MHILETMENGDFQRTKNAETVIMKILIREKEKNDSPIDEKIFSRKNHKNG